MITVRIGNGDSVTVTSEAGNVTITGNFSTFNPARVTIPLLSNTTHHLTVSAHVKQISVSGGCVYGNYTLSTTNDRLSAPLTIVQSSSGITTSPTQPGSTFTFAPTIDSYVDASSPTSNYGTLSNLRVDASTIVRSYLRFPVQGLSGNVTRATLLIYANSASNAGFTAHSVDNTPWSELTINYDNAPPIGSSFGSSGAFTAGTLVRIDVTAYIIGNAVYNFGLTTSSNTAISLASSEASANAPQLIIETTP